jgi:hypothetical protein
MFDTTTYVTNKTNIDADIRIHKAPTDKSIELLNEMQKKALDNILGTIHLQDNQFKYTVTFYHEYRFQKVIAEVQFMLNSGKHSFTCELEPSKYTNDLRSFLLEVKNKLAEKLAEIMLESTLNSLSRENQELIYSIQRKL